MAYTFDQIHAVDPSNPAVVAENGTITIFQPGDTSQMPLTITTTSGLPLANPLTVDAHGFGPAFMHATLGRVAWAGGGFTGYFTSYDDIKQDAVAAREAAEAALAAIEAGGGGGGGGSSNVVVLDPLDPMPAAGSLPAGTLVVRLNS